MVHWFFYRLFFVLVIQLPPFGSGGHFRTEVNSTRSRGGGDNFMEIKDFRRQ